MIIHASKSLYENYPEVVLCIYGYYKLDYDLVAYITVPELYTKHVNLNFEVRWIPECNQQLLLVFFRPRGTTGETSPDQVIDKLLSIPKTLVELHKRWSYTSA